MLMQQQLQANKSAINLRGSVQLITEFLHYSINSILYQRGIYPAEDFEIGKKYGLSLLVTNDLQLKNYLKTLLDQLEAWLLEKSVQKVVLVVQSLATQEVLERWSFDVHMQEGDKENVDGNDVEVSYKPEKEIHSEIQAILRQITASVTFLPVLEEKCTFNLLIYANRDTNVPEKWVESDPKYIQNAEQVKMRSFSTGLHKMDTLVCYKYDEDTMLM